MPNLTSLLSSRWVQIPSAETFITPNSWKTNEKRFSTRHVFRDGDLLSKSGMIYLEAKYTFLRVVRDVRFGSKLGQICPKWDKSGIFKDHFSVHFFFLYYNPMGFPIDSSSDRVD